jgi:hypothetical protein
MKPLYKIVNTLDKEINENGGILPEKYEPIAILLIAILQFAKVFTPQKVDEIIDKIIAVINVFLQAKK